MSRARHVTHNSWLERMFSGVERMFSNAGKLYDDEKKGEEDESLEHALFASANTE